MPRWAETLDRSIAALKGLHAPTERAFLGIGQSLRSAQDGVRGMADLAAETAGLLAGERMGEALRLLDDAVRSVRGLDLAEDQGGSDLGRIATIADAVTKPLSNLAAVVNEVEVLGVNAKIEAAHIDRTTSGFIVFTHEIARLAGRSRSMLERLLGGLADLRAAAATAIDHHDRFRVAHLREFEAVACRLESSAQALKARQARGEAALARLPAQVSGVAADIASLVSGLQAGDITRQRLEHVEAALDDLAVALPPRNQHVEMDPEQVRVFADAVCELEIGQLSDVRREFAARLGGIERDLGSLRQAAARLGSEAETVYAAGDGGGDFLSGIINDLGAVEVMLGRYAEAMETTDRSLKTVVEAANAMAESMAAISKVDTDMNLLGLNASIKCGNLGGKGRALNVVAQELRAYARRTRGLAEIVEKSIDEVRAVVGRLSGSASGTDSGRLRGVDEEIGTARERLAQLGRETRGVLAAVVERRGKLGRELDDAGRLLDPVGTFERTVEGVDADLRKVRAEVKPGLTGEQLEAARKSLLSFLSDRYTMASERELHAFLLEGKVGEMPAAKAPAKPAADDISDLLF